jgi:hypothetical protein
VVAQFVQDFFHLEGGEDGLDQHGGLDGALRQADVVWAITKMSFHRRASRWLSIFGR